MDIALSSLSWFLKLPNYGLSIRIKGTSKIKQVVFISTCHVLP